MNTPLKPCPMCGKSVAVVTTSAEMWPDYADDGCADSFAVVCDASAPNGPGGCGASGGFVPTESAAIERWNARTNTRESSAAQGAITDANVQRNIDLLRTRSQVGIEKYGTTTDKSGLTKRQWKQHLLEELLDAANYIQAELNTDE